MNDSTPKKGQCAVPGDIAQIANQQNESLANEALSLTNYFVSAETTAIIKNWGLLFQKNQKEAFCELLTLIFELAGHKILITPPHLDTVACDLVLPEFLEFIEANESTKPPLFQYNKSKKNLIFNFWEDISKQLISTQAFFNENYINFRSWVVNLSLCKIRILRQSTIYFVECIYITLANKIAQIDHELEQFSKIKVDASEALQSKIKTLDVEKKVYLKNCHFYCNSVLSKSIRDNEQMIRSISTEAIAKGACEYPVVFGDETHLKYLSWSLKDNSSKSQLVALKSILLVMSSLDVEKWSVLSDMISDDIKGLCEDRDNQIVEFCLRILCLMTENKKLPTQKLDNICLLVADTVASVRIAAAKFIFEMYFRDCANTEDELMKLIEFSKNFETQELGAAISSLFQKLKCVKDFDLMCEKMLVMDDDRCKQLSQIILRSAETVAGRIETNLDINIPELKRDASIALVTYLPNMITAFQTNPETQLPLILASRLLDLDSVSEHCADRLFTNLLSSIRDAFLSTSDKIIFNSAASVLYELSQGSHQLNEIAHSEIDRLAVGCGNISLGEKGIAIQKFLAAARFVNMSDNENIRNMLFASLESDDKSLIRDSIECLTLFFQWDVLHLKSNVEEIPKYEENYRHFVNEFSRFLDHEDESIRKEALIAFSSIYALQPILKSEYTHLSDDIANQYFMCFHSLKKSPSLFQSATRPVTYHVLSPKYCSHFLVYVVEDELKEYVQGLWNELKKVAPFDGSEVCDSLTGLIAAGMGQNQITLAGKYLYKKFRNVDVAQSFFQNEKKYDDIVSGIISFIVNLPKDSLEGFEHTEKWDPIFGAIMNDAKISAGTIKKVCKRHGEDNQNDDEPDESFSKI